ncbi:SMI1/KNR4 family protein [Xenorhabdus bovienii]|uniref:SMI1/KNR4 family protein n=1 Tax=Xenorhabdus bovienii TaxID=40576 RepID=UPI002E78D6B7|nr:SMI1/KNR4 family protein [Xenorhabdus bovienii]
MCKEFGDREQWPLIDEIYPFPNDFIKLINQYGTGKIANFITIFNPISNNNDLIFFKQKRFILDDFQYLIEYDNDCYKFNIFPNKNGLLPLGVTDNGDYIFWVTSPRDNSNLWKIAIIAARSPDVEYRDESLILFLICVFNKNIKCISFPTDFPSDTISFESF